MDSFPLYFDSDKLASISSSYDMKQIPKKEWAETAMRDFETQCKTGFFTKMDPAIDYVDVFADAIIHVDAWFAMMDFMRPGRNPGTEIMEAKAIRFEYNTLDIYDYSDSYFKKNKVRIPICLSLQHLYNGDSRGAFISTYVRLFNIFQKSKLVSLEVFGQLQKRYDFYKINPVYVSININDTIPL